MTCSGGVPRLVRVALREEDERRFHAAALLTEHDLPGTVTLSRRHPVAER